MYLENHVDTLAQAVYSAIAVDLSPVRYMRITSKARAAGLEGEPSERRPMSSEVEATHFTQMWGSTALGFSGLGGAAMTLAYTTIVQKIPSGAAAVYFSGRLAYMVEEPNEIFYDDMRNRLMADVATAVSRYQKGTFNGI